MSLRPRFGSRISGGGGSGVRSQSPDPISVAVSDAPLDACASEECVQHLQNVSFPSHETFTHSNLTSPDKRGSANAAAVAAVTAAASVAAQAAAAVTCRQRENGGEKEREKWMCVSRHPCCKSEDERKALPMAQLMSAATARTIVHPASSAAGVHADATSATIPLLSLFSRL